MTDLALETWPRVGEVPATLWRALSTAAPPFLEHAFLSGLEETGCVGPETGWEPSVITARDPEGEVLGGCAIYVKTHSMGEFVYDWSFADAARQYGIRYYPKAVITAPFSPIPSAKLLIHPDATERSESVRRALLEAAIQFARDAGCASVHMLFCTEEEAQTAQTLGFFARIGTQLHWENADYPDFDAYLARFKAKRRKEIRRERRGIRAKGLTIEAIGGDEIDDALCPDLYRFYRSTVERFMWGRLYLKPSFFELLWEKMRDRLRLTLARDAGSVVAGTLNFERHGRRHGRYWGTDVDVKHLHFELTAYSPIEDCIRRGASGFGAGAGDYAHKLARGFLPTLTRSVHQYFHNDFHRLIEAYCSREADAIQQSLSESYESPFIR